MKTLLRIITITAFLGFLTPILVLAQNLSLPNQFFGLVNFTDGVAPDGLVVEASINGVVVGNSVTVDGNYGYNPNLLFALDNQGVYAGEIVEFYVSGIKANETAVFVNGKSINLNLTVSGTVGTIEETDENAVIENETIAVTPTQSTNIRLGTNLSITVSSVTNTNATIEKIEKMTSGNVAVFSGKNFLNAYEIKISGKSLNISVTMIYDDTGIDEDTIAPYWFNGTTWVEITDSVVDKNANTITFTISSGSTTYAVFGSEPEPEPSPAPTGGGGGTPPTTPSSTTQGDINGDDKVDKYDFALMMANWGKTGSNDSDLNEDGKVDKYDFALLMVNWGI